MLESSKSNVKALWPFWGSQGPPWSEMVLCFACISSWQGLGVQVGPGVHALLKPDPLPADICHWMAEGKAAEGDSVRVRDRSRWAGFWELSNISLPPVHKFSRGSRSWCCPRSIFQKSVC